MNKYNLKVGDVITFTNKRNYKVVLTVTRTTEKSCYTDGFRNSWNTVNSYIERYADAEVKRSEASLEGIKEDFVSGRINRSRAIYLIQSEMGKHCPSNQQKAIQLTRQWREGKNPFDSKK